MNTSTLKCNSAIPSAISRHFTRDFGGSLFVKKGWEDAIAGRDFAPPADADPYYTLFYREGYHTAAIALDQPRIHYLEGRGLALYGLVSTSRNPAHKKGYESALIDLDRQSEEIHNHDRGW